VDFGLTEEQRMVQAAVRDFCRRELTPYAADVDKSGELRWEAIRKMPALGLTGMGVPEKFGGAEYDTSSAALAMEEVGRACGSTGLSLAAHNSLGCGPIVRWGSKAQKERYLPLLTNGNYLGALALTEPAGGSDLVGGVRTTAHLQDGAWVVNGHKAWITNARYAPVIIVLCRTDPEAGARGFSMILVEPDAEGVMLAKPESKMGLNGSSTQQITFDNVRVPAENLLGEQGRGFHQTMQTLDSGRIMIGALSLGLAQAAHEAALAYARERQAFGGPIAQFQAIQWMVADAAVEIEAARLLVWKAAWLKDRGQAFTKQAAAAKLKASEVAEKVCFHAIQIHGAYGYSREFPVERIYRDQRLMSIGEGTSEILRMVIARHELEITDRGDARGA
jgi:alkylation response protein AidB-like acyl-CoA dehydrogenase